MEGFSYQGISNQIASNYIDRHGNATWRLVSDLLANTNCQCPKLTGFHAYQNCGYRKTALTCANPPDLATCPVPALPLRKGDLNQLAFSLFFFLRDRCQGDLVGWLDQQFGMIDQLGLPDPSRTKADWLLKAFSEVYGVSTKLIAWMLGTLLMAGGSERPDWVKVSRSLVVIDSLVHNFLHRTGILKAFDQEHRYGATCQGQKGCIPIIHQLAQRIDAREFNPRFPAIFPRFIEYAIWAFCAEGVGNVCNGNQIDDRYPCTRLDCPVGDRCSRIPLRSQTA